MIFVTLPGDFEYAGNLPEWVTVFIFRKNFIPSSYFNFFRSSLTISGKQEYERKRVPAL